MATRTASAVTLPREVFNVCRPPSCRCSVTAALSKTTAPWRVAASARPTTYRPICIIALFFESIAPKKGEPTSCFRSSALRSAVSGSTSALTASKLRAIASKCGGFEASFTLPARRKLQSIPSSVISASIVSTESSNAL
ncbi:hypothetical protein D9M70_520720 [compost metagenome]